MFAGGPRREIAAGFPAYLATPFGWWQRNTRAARLRKPDGNCLLGRTGAVLALANVMNLFTNEFACLGGGRFALFGVASRAEESFLFWHGNRQL